MPWHGLKNPRNQRKNIFIFIFNKITLSSLGLVLLSWAYNYPLRSSNEIRFRGCKPAAFAHWFIRARRGAYVVDDLEASHEWIDGWRLRICFRDNVKKRYLIRRWNEFLKVPRNPMKNISFIFIFNKITLSSLGLVLSWAYNYHGSKVLKPIIGHLIYWLHE